ncbi:hypothetical protein JCM5350_004270 [Sporobolomyces pararoseus]
MLSTLLVALSTAAAVSAAPISLNVVEAALSTSQNQTYTANVVSYEMNGNAGACGWYNKDSDVVVGLPLEQYSALSSVSPYCGGFVVIKNLESNETTTALVADASTQNNTLSVSQGTWKALNGTATGLKTVEWRFANSTETAAAKEALNNEDDSTPSSSSSSSSSSKASSSSSSAQYVAPSSSSAAPVQQQKQAETSSTSEYVAPKTTSSAKAYVAPTTSYTPPKTTTQAYVAPKTTTQAPASSSFSGSYSGRATFYSQGGAAGSCGNYNSDSAYIVAVNANQMNSGMCGKSVTIRNTSNGKQINAQVADTCPGCSYGSLDLSMGAFGALGDYDQGVLPISWSFN